MPTTGVDTSGSSNAILSADFGAISIDEQYYHGFDAAPILPGMGYGLSVEWAQETGRDDLDEADPRSLLNPINEWAESKSLGIGFEQKTDTLERYSFNVPMPDSIIRHWIETNRLDPRNKALRKLAKHVRNIHEYNVWTLASASGSYASGHTSDPGNYNTTSTSLVGPGRAAVQKIMDDNGTVPDRVFLDMETADKLILLDEVQAFATSAGFNSDAPATIPILNGFFQSYFNCDLKIVSTKRWSGATGTQHLSARIVFATTRDEDRPWLRTLVNQEIPDGIDGIGTIREVRTDDPEGVKLIVDARHKVRVMFNTAAYALTGVLS